MSSLPWLGQHILGHTLVNYWSQPVTVPFLCQWKFWGKWFPFLSHSMVKGGWPSLLLPDEKALMVTSGASGHTRTLHLVKCNRQMWQNVFLALSFSALFKWTHKRIYNLHKGLVQPWCIKMYIEKYMNINKNEFDTMFYKLFVHLLSVLLVDLQFIA